MQQLDVNVYVTISINTRGKEIPVTDTSSGMLSTYTDTCTIVYGVILYIYIYIYMGTCVWVNSRVKNKYQETIGNNIYVNTLIRKYVYIYIFSLR